MLQFFHLERPSFESVRDARHLRRLVDVLVGVKDVSLLDWKAVPKPVFEADEAWFDIEALFRDDSMFGEFGGLTTRDLVPIKHGKRLAYFLEPQHTLKTLVTFRQMAQLIGAQRLRKIERDIEFTLGKKMKTVRGEIVSPTSLGRIRLLIEARVLTKLEERETYLNDDRDPFTDETAMDALNAYYGFIEALTASLYDSTEKRKREFVTVAVSDD